MSQATWYTGDALDVMRTFPDASVDLVITSPPFLALRSYLPADHPDKAREMGNEATPGEFVDALMLIVEESRRVLAPHGSLCIELGDTFAGSGGGGGDYLENGLREGQPGFAGSAQTQREGNAAHWRQKNRNKDAWPLAKSLTMVPELVRLTMAYGRNPLTGRETGQWRIRNVVRWVRPNPPVGALGDKFRPATSEMLVACVSPKRFFDLDAVRYPSDYDRPNLAGNGSRADNVPPGQRRNASDHTVNAAGAPPLDWWEIPTQPYKGAHYATFPKALVLKPIKAMCPEKVCNVCGVPSTRIAETVNAVGKAVGRTAWTKDQDTTDMMHSGVIEINANHPSVPDHTERRLLGWSDCGHNDWRRGIVLDPFAGSGTTLEVATGLGRNAIGIDIDERNLELAHQRIGMFLTEKELS